MKRLSRPFGFTFLPRLVASSSVPVPSPVPDPVPGPRPFPTPFPTPEVLPPSALLSPGPGPNQGEALPEEEEFIDVSIQIVGWEWVGKGRRRRRVPIYSVLTSAPGGPPLSELNCSCLVCQLHGLSPGSLDGDAVVSEPETAGPADGRRSSFEAPWP